MSKSSTSVHGEKPDAQPDLRNFFSQTGLSPEPTQLNVRYRLGLAKENISVNYNQKKPFKSMYENHIVDTIY